MRTYICVSVDTLYSFYILCANCKLQFNSGVHVNQPPLKTGEQTWHVLIPLFDAFCIAVSAHAQTFGIWSYIPCLRLWQTTSQSQLFACVLLAFSLKQAVWPRSLHKTHSMQGLVYACNVFLESIEKGCTVCILGYNDLDFFT